MNYEQLDALNGIMCMAEAAGWSLSGLAWQWQGKKTPLPHLNESHNKGQKSKGVALFFFCPVPEKRMGRGVASLWERTAST